MEVKWLIIWSHTRSKFRTTKLQIQGEQKHFFDMSKDWSKLAAVQVIELLFQQAGRANQININLSAFLKIFNRFSYWIWSWRRQVRESRRLIYFWMMRKEERFSKTCDSFRLFKKQSNYCSLGKKILLKVFNCLLLH